jgi:hypothetical protein
MMTPAAIFAERSRSGFDDLTPGCHWWGQRKCQRNSANQSFEAPNQIPQGHRRIHTPPARTSLGPTRHQGRDRAGVKRSRVQIPARLCAVGSLTTSASPIASLGAFRPAHRELNQPTAFCRCARGACTQASSRGDVGLPPAPPGSGEYGVLGSSPAWHSRPSR